MLTLKLKGWGGLVEEGVITDNNYNKDSDVSWRVDYDAIGNGVVDDKLDVPAAGSRVDITLVGDYSKIKQGQDHLRYETTGASNAVWVKENNGTWTSNPSTAKLTDLIISNGDGTYTIKVYVQPLGGTAFNTLATPLNNYEAWTTQGYVEHKFTLDVKSNSSLADEFTIRQWLPMPVMVDSNGNPLSSTNPNDAAFYFSRFDIYHGELLPWGSTSIDLSSSTDKTNGFANTVTYFNQDKNNINFNDGQPTSIMEYAVFESANAELPATGMFNQSPQIVTTMNYYGLATVEEWKWIELYGIQDLNYPMTLGTLYWTSSTTDTGTASYVYQYGTAGTSKQIKARGNKYTGRLVYHKNNQVTVP